LDPKITGSMILIRPVVKPLALDRQSEADRETSQHQDLMPVLQVHSKLVLQVTEDLRLPLSLRDMDIQKALVRAPVLDEEAVDTEEDLEVRKENTTNVRTIQLGTDVVAVNLVMVAVDSATVEENPASVADAPNLVLVGLDSVEEKAVWVMVVENPVTAVVNSVMPHRLDRHLLLSMVDTSTVLRLDEEGMDGEGSALALGAMAGDAVVVMAERVMAERVMAERVMAEKGMVKGMEVRVMARKATVPDIQPIHTPTSRP